MNETYDIVIVGGGLVGTTLALALMNTPFRIALVEAHTPKQHQQSTHDMRAIALSYASRQIFQQLNLWDDIETTATAIKKIHVSEQKRFGNTLLNAEEINLEAFGYVVPIPLLYNALQEKLTTQNSRLSLLRPATVTAVKHHDKHWQLTVNDKNIETSMLIAADGDRSFIRETLKLPIKETHYEQTAIVTNAAISKPHQNTAFERFTPYGTLAVLPLQDNRVALIWAMPNPLAQTWLAQNDAEFLNEIQKVFGYRLGKLSDLGRRQSYPLREIHAERQTLPGLVLLGNAAHALHPIAAQGFNLGLRDVAALAKCLQDAKDLHDKSLLDNYLNTRQHDQEQTQHFTHRLVKLFTPQVFPLPTLRSLGLMLFDLMPENKREFCWKRIGA